MQTVNMTRRGFSLIELVIVVVIIGIIGAIAIPRMSRGAEGAADSALVANLAVLRNAVDLFQAEHQGVYPDFDDMPNALLQYSDINASSYGARDAASGVIYGPYVRVVPPLPVGANKGKNAFVATQGGTAAGWVYDETTGQITANCPNTEVDARGIQYNAY